MLTGCHRAVCACAYISGWPRSKVCLTLISAKPLTSAAGSAGSFPSTGAAAVAAVVAAVAVVAAAASMGGTG